MPVFKAYDSASNTASDLVTALLASSPELTVDTNSIQFVGSSGQVSFYDGSLTPLGIGAGILLTSGDGTPANSNTSVEYGEAVGTPGDSDLDGALVGAGMGTGTNDAAYVEFSFFVNNPDVKTITFDILFGSDEYPEYADDIVDIAGVFVNGKNYALFNNDPAQPLSVLQSNIDAGNFINNRGGSLPIEYDGVSVPLTIVAPVRQGTNTIKIAIADTSDAILDSGLFVSNLKGGTGTGGGINHPPTLAASVTSAAYTNTVGDDSFAPVVGFLTSTDPDTRDNQLFGVTGGAASGTRAGYDIEKANTYGTLFLNSSTGAYFYEPNDAAIESLRSGAIETYTLTVTDSSGASDSLTFTVDLTAANEPPANSPPAAIDDEATIKEDASSLEPRTFTGNVLSNDSDPDAGDSLLVSAAAGSVVGQEIQGTYGTLTLHSDGSYTYSLANTDALIEGEQGVEQFAYVVSDNAGLTDAATLTLIIQGSDLDLPRNGEFKAHRGADRVTGGQGDDRFTGRAGSDILSGEDGADILWGEDGDDQLFGAKGSDQAVGGSGHDVIWLGSGDDRGWGEAGDDILHGEEGDDVVDGGDDDDLVLLGSGDDKGFGGRGDDRLSGEEGHDHLIGGNGEDTVEGESGNDKLWGGGGADTLRGGNGADQFNGGSDNDRIYLDEGNDTAWGGNGNDRFIFSRSFGDDVIKDFQSGDKIVLESVFKSFSQLEDHMRQAGDDVVIDAPGQGNTITVENVGSLRAQDFDF